MRGTLLTRLGLLLVLTPFVYLVVMAILDRPAWWTADESTQQFRTAFLYGCLVIAALFGAIEFWRQRKSEDGRRRAGAILLLFACLVAFFPITAVISAPNIRRLPARAESETELQQIYEALTIYAANSPNQWLPLGDPEHLLLSGDAWAQAAEETVEIAPKYLYLPHAVDNEEDALLLLETYANGATQDQNLGLVEDLTSSVIRPAPRSRLNAGEAKEAANETFPILFEQYDPARGGGNVLYQDGRVEFVRSPNFPYTAAFIKAVEAKRDAH